MMRTYRVLNRDYQKGSTFDIRITLAIMVALTATTTVLHSLVFLSVQPTSLAAELRPVIGIGPVIIGEN
jgi:hypothetical protein